MRTLLPHLQNLPGVMKTLLPHLQNLPGVNVCLAPVVSLVILSALIGAERGHEMPAELLIKREMLPDNRVLRLLDELPTPPRDRQIICILRKGL